MTDPIRHNWPQIIRELEAAGYTTYKIALCIGRSNGNRVVERWRDHPGSPGPRHYEGELLLALRSEASSRVGDASETHQNSPRIDAEPGDNGEVAKTDGDCLNRV